MSKFYLSLIRQPEVYLTRIKIPKKQLQLFRLKVYQVIVEQVFGQEINQSWDVYRRIYRERNVGPNRLRMSPFLSQVHDRTGIFKGVWIRVPEDVVRDHRRRYFVQQEMTSIDRLSKSVILHLRDTCYNTERSDPRDFEL